MKKIYSLFLAFLLLGTIANAQMVISRVGNTVTFTHTLSVPTWNSAPYNLYVYVDAVDAQGTGTNMGTQQILSLPWPGTPMVGAPNTYSLSFDLSAFYGIGVFINDIRYIYNNGIVGFGSAQNPVLGSFSAFNDANVKFVPFTISGLGTEDVNKVSKSNFNFASNKLIIEKAGNFSVSVYNTNGSLVKQMKISGNSQTDLALQKGLYIANISSASENESIKLLVK